VLVGSRATVLRLKYPESTSFTSQARRFCRCSSSGQEADTRLGATGSVFTIYLPPYCLRGGRCPILPNPPFQPILPLLRVCTTPKTIFSQCALAGPARRCSQGEAQPKGGRQSSCTLAPASHAYWSRGGRARESAHSVPTYMLRTCSCKKGWTRLNALAVLVAVVIVYRRNSTKLDNASQGLRSIRTQTQLTPMGRILSKQK
jgi:hypothetical protein